MASGLSVQVLIRWAWVFLGVVGLIVAKLLRQASALGRKFQVEDGAAMGRNESGRLNQLVIFQRTHRAIQSHSLASGELSKPASVAVDRAALVDVVPFGSLQLLPLGRALTSCVGFGAFKRLDEN